MLALLAYSLLTRATLGTAGRRLSLSRIFRIQLSTKALSNIVPGGNAASSALGYRLLTLSGISGPDAGFALATAGIGSAVVLNIIFWTGLTMSIPFRGVNEGYALAALAGIIIMGLAAGLVVGVMDGSGRAERVVRWFARKVRLDEDRFAAVLHQLAERLEELVSDRQLLWRVVFWATANWLLDAASLWVFLRAYGVTLAVDALLVAFGLANVLAAIPILPGGLGVVEATYLTALVGFGVPRRVAAPAIATYRSAQYLMPIAIGALAYASLRVGPWKIEKRDRLVRLRDLARSRVGEGRDEDRLRAAFRRQRRSADPESDPAIAATLQTPIPTTTSRHDERTTSDDADAFARVACAAVPSATMTVHERPFGRYLEDFTPGDVLRHWPGKTITEYDDHLFCMITMNHHPLHTNDWFAAESVQGRNVVVGNLVYSLVSRHERARREWRGDRQPRGRDAAAQVPDVPRRHDPRRDPGARGQGVVVEARPRHRQGRDEGLQPGRQGSLLLQAQGADLEARVRPRPQAPVRRHRRLGRLSSAA